MRAITAACAYLLVCVLLWNLGGMFCHYLQADDRNDQTASHTFVRTNKSLVIIYLMQVVNRALVNSPTILGAGLQ